MAKFYGHEDTIPFPFLQTLFHGCLQVKKRKQQKQKQGLLIKKWQNRQEKLA